MRPAGGGARNRRRALGHELHGVHACLVAVATARPPLDESGENGRVAVERALGYVRVSRVGTRQGDSFLSPDLGKAVNGEPFAHHTHDRENERGCCSHDGLPTRWEGQMRPVQSTSTLANTCHASRLVATRLSQRYQRSP